MVTRVVRCLLAALIPAVALAGCPFSANYHEGGGGPTNSAGSGGAAITCEEDLDCDDDNPCTADRCLGACEYENDDWAIPTNPNECVHDTCLDGDVVHHILAGEACGAAKDWTCDDEGRCLGCQNQVRDGVESDVDCGGPDCSPCANGQACLADTDCQSLACSTICLPPSCVDGVLNNGEQAIDCGGPSCPFCDGAPCTNDAGCRSGACMAGYCRTKVGGACVDDFACASNLCISGLCVACADDSDCAIGVGGCMFGICKVPASAPCSYNTDCASGACYYNLCKRVDGMNCLGDLQCVSGRCATGNCQPCINTCNGGFPCINGICLLPTDAYCAQNSQCNSGSCAGFPPRCL